MWLYNNKIEDIKKIKKVKEGEMLKIEINKDTTIFAEKENDSNVYKLEIANHSSRKKIADVKLERITGVRFHVKEVHSYELE